MGVTVTVTGERGVVARIDNVQDRAKNVTRAWKGVGSYLTKITRQQFTTEGRRLGTPWKPLKPYYKLWKIQHGFDRRILIQTGAMRDKFIRRPMDIEEYGPGFGVFGAKDMKAVWMQGGTRRNGRRINPPRKILVATPEVKDEVRDILARYIMRGETVL